MADDSTPAKKRRSRSRSTPLEYTEAAERLAEHLETRVRIDGRSKGRVVIEFADVTDLARIVDTLLGQ